MNVVIDASVFVAASLATEEHYASSDAFLERLADETAFCPVLVLPECAGAIMRATKNPTIARKVLRQLRNPVWLNLIPLENALAERSAEAAIRCSTRGADSCYIGLAVQLRATLVTWDKEMLERGSELVETTTPEQWLQEHRRETQEPT